MLKRDSRLLAPLLLSSCPCEGCKSEGCASGGASSVACPLEPFPSHPKEIGGRSRGGRRESKGGGGRKGDLHAKRRTRALCALIPSVQNMKYGSRLQPRCRWKLKGGDYVPREGGWTCALSWREKFTPLCKQQPFGACLS
jgi:hypothetical protein